MDLHIILQLRSFTLVVLKEWFGWINYSTNNWTKHAWVYLWIWIMVSSWSSRLFVNLYLHLWYLFRINTVTKNYILMASCILFMPCFSFNKNNQKLTMENVIKHILALWRHWYDLASSFFTFMFWVEFVFIISYFFYIPMCVHVLLLCTCLRLYSSLFLLQTKSFKLNSNFIA